MAVADQSMLRLLGDVTADCWGPFPRIVQDRSGSFRIFNDLLVFVILIIILFIYYYITLFIIYIFYLSFDYFILIDNYFNDRSGSSRIISG